jgi:hypothetical protein
VIVVSTIFPDSEAADRCILLVAEGPQGHSGQGRENDV